MNRLPTRLLILPCLPCLLALLLGLTPPLAGAAGSGVDSSGVDPAVRVQDDLFKAVNGGWLARTEIPADKAEAGTWIVLDDLSNERVRAIVNELAASSQVPGSVQGKIAAVYGAFVDTVAIDRAGLAPARPLLDSVAAINSRVALARWFGRAQGVVDTPISLWVMPDAKEPGINRALTWQGGLGLPDRDYYLKDDERMTQARAAYLVYLTRLATLAGERRPAQLARQALALEQRIAEVHWDAVANRDSVKTYNPVTVPELARHAPGLDWSALLVAAGLPKVDRLSVSQPSTANGVAQLVAEVDLAQWRGYLRLRVLDAFAQVLPEPFRAAHFAFHGTAITGTQEVRPRWQKGIAEVNGALGEAVGQVYVARHFPAAHKARMADLVTNLMAAYRESIGALTWMTPATRAAALDKLARYQLKIGHPERWRDYGGLQVRDGDAFGNHLRSARFEWQRIAAKAGQPVDRSEWGMTPQTVNAYYDGLRNEIVFPAAVLQPPFFDATVDDAVNYGAIGAIIGHEISHGFDDDGSQYDGEGRLRNWWTDQDRAAFDAIGAQLVAQYDAYEVLPGRHLSGKLTLGENIADLSGLQVAYKAWLRSLGGQPTRVIDGRSGAQRFFLGWAQAWREKVRESRALQLLTIDPHSPTAFRANGAAVNHDAFHEAFGTQPGDGMYKAPQARIRLW